MLYPTKKYSLIIISVRVHYILYILCYLSILENNVISIINSYLSCLLYDIYNKDTNKIMQSTLSRDKE